LKSITEKKDWESWILYILDAVEQTSYQTIKKIDAIAQLMEEFIEIIKKELPKIYSKDLVEALFARPYCRVSSIVDANIVERQTASQYLKKLKNFPLLRALKWGEIWFILILNY
jgi:Fic family protein